MYLIKKYLLIFFTSFVLISNIINSSNQTNKTTEKTIRTQNNLTDDKPFTINDKHLQKETTKATSMDTSKNDTTVTPTIEIKELTSINSEPPIKKKVQAQQYSYICDCTKSCKNLSCVEAQYQLKICGCKKRDGDNDGIACDGDCQ